MSPWKHRKLVREIDDIRSGKAQIDNETRVEIYIKVKVTALTKLCLDLYQGGS